MLPLRPLLLVTLCAMAIASAQPVPHPALVPLDVVALDAHDRPVSGLTAADFQVAENGKPQPIIFFRSFGAAPAASLGPHEFSNRGEGRPPVATAVLFDLLNQGSITASNAQEELTRALARVESLESVALYLLARDGRLHTVRPLTAGEDWKSQLRPMLAAAFKEVFALPSPNLAPGARVSMTYSALDTLGRTLGAVPGRKNIVWITHGVPITLPNAAGGFVDFQPLVRNLGAALVRSRVALYPVQQAAPGLAAPSTDEAQYSGAGSQETLLQLAELTGGRTKSMGEIASTLRQAIADGTAGYEIAFAPPASDGKHHKVTLSCSRKGVRTQTRGGYYAAEPDAKAVVDGIVAAPADAAGIGLRLRAAASEADPQAVRLDLRIDADDVAFMPEEGRSAADLRIAVVGYDENGRGQASQLIPLTLRLSTAEREAVAKDGIPYRRDVRLGGSVRTIRIVVVDLLLGDAGSVTVPAAKLH